MTPEQRAELRQTLQLYPTSQPGTWVEPLLAYCESLEKRVEALEKPRELNVIPIGEQATTSKGKGGRKKKATTEEQHEN